MIYLLLDKEIVELYNGTDEIYENTSPFQRWKLNRWMKRAIKFLPESKTMKLVCGEDSISYSLKIAKLLKRPVIIMKGKDQYLSTSEFWSDYVCFK